MVLRLTTGSLLMDYPRPGTQGPYVVPGIEYREVGHMQGNSLNSCTNSPANK